MMASKPTPGPWKTSFLDDTRIEDKNGFDVAMALGEYSTESDCMEANARLIAACPTMLEYIHKMAASGEMQAIELLEKIA